MVNPIAVTALLTDVWFTPLLAKNI